MSHIQNPNVSAAIPLSHIPSQVVTGPPGTDALNSARRRRNAKVHANFLLDTI